MSDLNRARTVNSTSNIAFIQAFDTATGKPKTGMTHSTSGLVIYAAKNTAAPASIGTLVTMTEGTWTTLGFKECANVPGTYQIGVPNTWYDTAGALLLTGRVTSDDTVYFRPVVIQITTSDIYAGALTAADIVAAEKAALDGLSNGATALVIDGTNYTVTRAARDAIATITAD